MSKDTGGPAFPVSTENYAPYAAGEGMSLRQYAAIKLRVPSSGAEWLDEMIVQSLRDEFAAKSMQGLVVLMDNVKQAAHIPKAAYAIADAMLKVRAE